MKKIVLTYGIIGGIIVSTMLFMTLGVEASIGRMGNGPATQRW